MRRLEKERFRFFRGQRGISLIETVVALAILGLIGVAFLSALTTTSKAVMISDEDVTVESLAKSQAEHIKAQDYIPVDAYDPVTTCYEEIAIPADLISQYDIEIQAPVRVPEAAEVGEPFELQKVTVVIKRDGKGVFTMSIYREGSSTA